MNPSRPSPVRVGVGSGNPVKRSAVERALDHGNGGSRDEAARGAIVEAVPVPSGVSEQPFGHRETIDGADHRARSVLDEGPYDLGIGIEGGVARAPDGSGLFLVMWVAVADGARIERGSGPSVRLPGRIASRVEAGAELGPVMDDVLDTTGVARRGGAIAALTNGRVDRTDALATAVAGAIGPFVSELYDGL